jgi:hypothetical protein
VILMKRAAFACECGAVVWQAPIDFLCVGAWPASLDPNHLHTVVEFALLQQFDSLRLFCPGMSLSGFLKGIADAAHKSRPSQVGAANLLVTLAYVALSAPEWLAQTIQRGGFVAAPIVLLCKALLKGLGIALPLHLCALCRHAVPFGCLRQGQS